MNGWWEMGWNEKLTERQIYKFKEEEEEKIKCLKEEVGGGNILLPNQESDIYWLDDVIQATHCL